MAHLAGYKFIDHIQYLTQAQTIFVAMVSAKDLEFRAAAMGAKVSPQKKTYEQISVQDYAEMVKKKGKVK